MSKRQYIYLNLIIILSLEVLTCLANYVFDGFSYVLDDAIILVAFVVFQTVFSLNIDNFTNGRNGLINFMIYKGAKAFCIIVPLFLYLLLSKQPDLWTVAETALYYFVFLIVETVIFVKHPRDEKTA